MCTKCNITWLVGGVVHEPTAEAIGIVDKWNLLSTMCKAMHEIWW
jgi:hypothetical protein